MLVQSNEDRIVLLPALPAKWSTGHIYGGRVAGNASVDISWENRELKKAVLFAYSDIDTMVKIPFGAHKGERHITCEAGESIELV